LLGFPVEVVSSPEATALGAASLAARATGMWLSDDYILRQVRVARTYQPTLAEAERRMHMDRFNEAILHLKAWQPHA
jgi:glycerol kinase